MIIETSQIHLSSEHQKVESSERYRSLQLFAVELNAASVQSGPRIALPAASAPASALSPRALTSPLANMLPPAAPDLLPMQPPALSSADAAPLISRSTGVLPSMLMSPNLFELLDEGTLLNGTSPLRDQPAGLFTGAERLFQGLLEALTGRRNDEPAASGSFLDGGRATQMLSAQAEQAGRVNLGVASQARRSLQVSLTVTEHIKESECSRFHACGSVQTADGQTLDLDLNLHMSRSFESVRRYDATEEILFKDPLVVNFAGAGAELTENSYAFDLDADGEMDWISALTQGGMLALDRNDDGVINDGSELFGALSGDGFADLARFDDDRNGWIDAADDVFADLRLWNRQDDGDRMDTLKERDIGAIYLGSSDTPFDLKGGDNQTLGQVRASGIFLTESGEVGTVQQIDLAV